MRTFVNVHLLTECTKEAVSNNLTNAGYTPQDKWADFGMISSLLTILDNVPIILVVLKIIFSDFPVV